jgi:hypothetical protein
MNTDAEWLVTLGLGITLWISGFVLGIVFRGYFEAEEDKLSRKFSELKDRNHESTR